MSILKSHLAPGQSGAEVAGCCLREVGQGGNVDSEQSLWSAVSMWLLSPIVLRSREARGARGARRAHGAREARGARGAREARQARGARGARAGSMNPFCFLHCIWSSSTNSSV